MYEFFRHEYLYSEDWDEFLKWYNAISIHPIIFPNSGEELHREACENYKIFGYPFFVLRAEDAFDNNVHTYNFY